MKILFVLMLSIFSLSGHGDNQHERSTVETSQFSNNDIATMAELWGLTKEELIRYHEIINGPLGKWNPDIDPVMALGLHAKNEAERRRYAEIYAMQEFELTEMTQLFQREYDKAFKLLFPESKIINPTLLKPYYDKKAQKDLLRGHASNSAFRSGDRLLYFADSHCSSCSYQVKKLEKVMVNGANKLIGIGVDIYIVNAKNETDVRQWAVNNNVSLDLVKNSQITLNVDNGLHDKLNSASHKKSDMYLLRNEETFVIDPSQVGL